MNCEYAGCRHHGVVEEDGWWFCREHLREHRRLMAEDFPHLFRRGRRIDVANAR